MRLHIVIHAENIVSVGILKGCHQGIMLSEVPHEIDSDDIVILFAELSDLIECPVCRAIIDQHELALITVILFELLGHHIHHLVDGLLRIVAWYDNRYKHMWTVSFIQA